MYTVCPKCALPLAVTAADLRAGQGYVRCGRCANVFNALLRLSEESALGASGPNDLELPLYIEDMDKASATLSRPALPETAEAEPIRVAEVPLPPPIPSAAEILAPTEFEDPDSTNPKIGIAPLHLVPPQPTSRSPSLWLVDSPPRAPAGDIDIDIEDDAADESLEASENAAPYAKTDEDHLADEPDEPGESGESGEPGEVNEMGDADEEFDFVDEDNKEAVKYRGTGTFETIVLEGDTFLQTEETIPEEVLASEIADVSRRIAEAHNTAEFAALMDKHFDDEPESESKPVASETEADPAPELAALREATGEFTQGARTKPKAEDPSDWFATIRSFGDWRLMAGAAALAAVLVLQAVNHWRDDLATRAGWFGAMRELSSILGEPLHPNWNLGNYDVRQLGATPDAYDSQTLKVRLRLTNVGERAQALPLIRLTLRDRFGKAVSRGELRPDQYLPEDERGQVMIRRDQRIDTEIRVLDPSRQASSFELDVCVSAAGGGLRCAGDTPTLAARTS